MSLNYSKILITLTIVLLIFGLLTLFSASVVVAQQDYGDAFYFVKRQIIQGVILGGVVAFLASRLPLSFWQKLAPLLLIFNVILVALCFVPPFKVANAPALRWLKIGPISFQPSEFLKITYPAFLAAILCRSNPKERKKVFGKPFLTFLFSFGLISGLMFIQPSTGTVLIIGLASLAIYFTSGLSLKQIIVLIIITIIVGSYLFKVSPYRLQRIISFKEGEEDPLKSGYHIEQSLIGIGSGGIFGLGFLKSVQKFFYLPESHTDSIFSVISEEFGFIGSIILIVLYLSLILVGLKIASKSINNFNKFFAIGLISHIGFQTFINIAVMTKIIPATGVPLPFISYGSSSLITSLVSIGILSKIASGEVYN
ncbi:MAG TPA: putative peptidoglycan glycosyltransferase FtsW [Candidatus Paceibacterota bacterium]|nr:putative peptidoglycan glycosyltransferase FtsW [Candidatus Paceibacterota bacterium]